jgi:hypothetical protein
MHFVPGLRDYLRYVEHVPSDQEITRRNSCEREACTGRVPFTKVCKSRLSRLPVVQ